MPSDQLDRLVPRWPFARKTWFAASLRNLLRIPLGLADQLLKGRVDGLRAGVAHPLVADHRAVALLSLAGVKNDRAEIRRAVAFLVNSQKDDGSWPMSRRGHP